MRKSDAKKITIKGGLDSLNLLLNDALKINGVEIVTLAIKEVALKVYARSLQETLLCISKQEGVFLDKIETGVYQYWVSRVDFRTIAARAA